MHSLLHERKRGEERASPQCIISNVYLLYLFIDFELLNLSLLSGNFEGGENKTQQSEQPNERERERETFTHNLTFVFPCLCSLSLSLSLDLITLCFDLASHFGLLLGYYFYS